MSLLPMATMQLVSGYAATPISIAQEDFIINCFGIPLGGFDVVLDVQWLQTLGPICWDFDKLSMSFWRNDHQVSWRDIAAV